MTGMRLRMTIVTIIVNLIVEMVIQTCLKIVTMATMTILMTVSTPVNTDQQSAAMVDEKETNSATTPSEIAMAASLTVQALLRAGIAGEAIPTDQTNASNHVQRTNDSSTINMKTSVMTATQGTGTDAQVLVSLSLDTLVEK